MVIAGMESDPELPPQFREDVVMMRRNIELECRLIDDMLDLTRVSSGKLRLSMQLVNLHTLIHFVVTNCKAEASAQNITILLNLGATADQVYADPARMQQVLWNLLRNSLKFTPNGGSIFITSQNHDPTKCRIQIQDTGIGIPRDALPKIFNAFEQGDLKNARKFGGLGLGLAICKAIVETHSGTITAQSDGPDTGATFTLEMPLAGANANQTAK
jgi:hypothetical protein